MAAAQELNDSDATYCSDVGSEDPDWTPRTQNIRLSLKRKKKSAPKNVPKNPRLQSPALKTVYLDRIKLIRGYLVDIREKMKIYLESQNYLPQQSNEASTSHQVDEQPPNESFLIPEIHSSQISLDSNVNDENSQFVMDEEKETEELLDYFLERLSSTERSSSTTYSPRIPVKILEDFAEWESDREKNLGKIIDLSVQEISNKFLQDFNDWESDEGNSSGEISKQGISGKEEIVQMTAYILNSYKKTWDMPD